MPPSRALVRMTRSFMLLALGCTCLTLWIGCKAKSRLCWLVLESAKRFTQHGILSEAEVRAEKQVALVPGTSIHGSLLRQRVEAAARLFHAGKVSHLILSGDGRQANYHEPHVMRRMLTDLRVPAWAMTEDAAGLSTFESIQRAGQMAGGRRLIIVTQELHCPRALLLARGLGVEALACALPSEPSAAGVVREERACARALLDLAGMRAWTQSMEREGAIRVANWTLATL